jgi:hypothetical protein
MPDYFGDWQAVEAFRKRLLTEVEAGRMSNQTYRRRIRLAFARYNKQDEARTYYARREHYRLSAQVTAEESQ